ncbi:MULTISPECIES: homing endonuclease associated repeat-containing protein [unclassified Burkholderia]|uniref:homing endonuclease associated repeat-containing protein n=1 Tax=unclassified Burkholderia TaxID=2613784 RepID=UPI002AB00270|nr:MULTISPECIES: HNH endonuclease [unclassified Burkholderia]
MPVSDEELLADLRSTATDMGKLTIGQKDYLRLGKYDVSTAIRRFGSWNEALIRAGLAVSNEVDISDQRLFENILALWQHFGRQPRRSELAQLPSTISQSPYNRRFGSWSAALHAFVEYANDSDEAVAPVALDSSTPRRRTGRDPSLRLRWHVLQRDHFTCRACGASPALTPGVELHVDHIVAWSNGGDTVFENLQTLCSVCNLGKSNV